MRIDSAGNVGIGAASILGYTIWNAKNMTGGSTTVGQINVGTIQSDCTANASMYMAQPSTAAASFTLPVLVYYNTYQSTFGAGSAVTSQIGFRAQASMIGATTNYAFQADNTAAVTSGKTAYGFYSAVNAATGGGTTYGFYAAGTADNYFAGNVGIGTNSTLDTKVRIGGAVVYPASGGSSFGLKVNGIAGAGGTSNAGCVISIATTEDAVATYSNVYSFYAQQGTVSGGSRLGTTNYFGFIVDSTPVNATNNYGFYSNISSAANRYNFYAAGTAPNYFGGNVTVGGGGTLGYGAGSGGTVTQATSKATAVTLNKSSGQITTHNAALAAGATVSFTWNNSMLTATDTVVTSMKTGYATFGAYSLEVENVSAGTATVVIRNNTGGSLSEAFTFSFSIIKGSTS
jgi:hypothetical protein